MRTRVIGQHETSLNVLERICLYFIGEVMLTVQILLHSLLFPVKFHIKITHR